MTEVEDRINANARRKYWRTKLSRGDRVPTREVLAIVHEGLDRFREWNAELPLPNTTAWIVETERWLERNRLKILRLMEQEQ